jgi:FkbM family methyltransferase
MNLLKNLLLAGMRKRLPGFGFTTLKLYAGGIITKNKFGVRMQLNPYEAVEGSVLFDGYFDEPVLQAITENLLANEVFWDIGANVGLHTLTVKKIKPDVECIAFEPFYKNFERLCFNQALNPDLQVLKYNLALADQSKIEKLYTSFNNSGRTSLQPLQDSLTTEIFIPTVTGDSLIQSAVPRPHVIKLDTEGTELAILQGCLKLLQESQLRVVVYESFTQQTEIEKFLMSFGFSIKPIDSLSNFIAVR